jgi:hypothetical protein
LFQYYVWRTRHLLKILGGLIFLTAIILVVNLLGSSITDDNPVELPDSVPMFIVERTYTKEEGFSYIYSDGRFLYDNDLQRLPRLSPSFLDRIEIDIVSTAAGVFETYAGSRTINPLSIDRAGFQYDIPYNFYGSQRDIALYIALMLGAGFEVESLYETKDNAVLELSFEDERVRIVVGRNRLRVYSKMIGINEFG